MTFAFARVGAAVAMRVEDYYPQGKRWWVRLHEKGGKRHEMPAHHKLEAYLDAYLAAAGIRNEGKGPLFRGAAAAKPACSPKPMTPRRRLPHDPPSRGGGGLQEQARRHVPRDRHHRLSRGWRHAGKRAAMAAHESPRTTKLYDRTGDEIRWMKSSGSRFRVAVI